VSSAPLEGIASFDDFVNLLHRLGREAAGDEKNIAGASLAVPGPFDCEAGVSLMEHKLQFLYRKDLRGALAAKFSWSPDQLRFLNDACSFLLGEVGAGSVRGAARAAGLTLGTGVGSAFAVDGRAVTEGKGVPPGGEIWDYPYAGGTVEDLISTRKLKADYLALTGRDEEVVAIAKAAQTEPAARQVFEAFGSNLGHVLRDVIAPFMPDMVVIGGGISRSASLFLPHAERKIAGMGFSVVTSTLLDQAPLVGAAQYWREELAHSADQAFASR
jgi:glucokinase